MTLPIDRTAKAAIDTNLVNGILSDGPKLKASDDVVYNTIDELYNYTNGLISAGTLSKLGIINVKDYNASGLATTFTGSIASGTKALTLTTTPDFVQGQGINLQGALEASSLQITGAATVSSNVTVTLNGVAFLVAVVSGDTAIQVATKIRAATYAGWTAGGTAGTDTVTFTSTTSGVKTDSAYSAGTTTATGTLTTTIQGTADQISKVSSVSGLVINIADNATRTIAAGMIFHEDSAAFQSAINACGSDDTIIIADGTYNVNITIPTYGPSLIGTSNNKVILKSTSSTGYAITINKKGLTVSDWSFIRIENICFLGDAGLTRGAISFGQLGNYVSGDELIGRVKISNCTFKNLNKAIFKPFGNIGNVIEYCAFENCNYHYYVDKDTTQGTYTMHGGNDVLYKNHFRGGLLASLYIYSPQDGTGQTIIRDCIIESNSGFAIFCMAYNALDWAPGLMLENVWFENNATSASVTINTVAYTPQDIYLKDSYNINMKECILGKITLVNSKMYTDACSTGSDGFIVTKDSNSFIYTNNLMVYKNTKTNFYASKIIYSQIAAGNGSSIFSTKPRQKITQAYSANMLYAESFANKNAYTLSGGDTSRTATTVADGVIFDSCAELSIPTTGVNTLGTGTTIPTNKYIVWSYDAKLVSGLAVNVFNQYSSPLSGSNMISNTDWKSFVGFTNTLGITAFTSALWIYGPASGTSVVRFSAYQVMAFDALEDAIKYLDSGLYQVGATQPRLTYSNLAPTTGTWKVGDRVQMDVPVVGSPKGWMCTVAGTPGTWVSEGNL